jgi:hypothetical protein
MVPAPHFAAPKGAFTNTFLTDKTLLINRNTFQTSFLIRWSPGDRRVTRVFVLVACATLIDCCKDELRAKKFPGWDSITIFGYSLDFRSLRSLHTVQRAQRLSHF